MKGSMSVSGTGHVQSMFRSIGERVPDAARGQMKRAADRVVKLAKLQTPEDTGDLANSIRIEKTYDNRRRLQIDIIAGNETVTKFSGQVVDLNEYAAMVHEAYETSIAPNGPGPNTLAKMAANPGIKIGSGFLRRAFEKEDERLDAVMVSVVSKIVAQEKI